LEEMLFLQKLKIDRSAIHSQTSQNVQISAANGCLVDTHNTIGFLANHGLHVSNEEIGEAREDNHTLGFSSHLCSEMP
jgi:hypothetical protein